MDEITRKLIFASTYPRLSAQGFLAFLSGGEYKNSPDLSMVMNSLKGNEWRSRSSQIARLCEKSGIIPLSFIDSHYPQGLREVGYSPPVIFARGDVDALNGFSGAVVGSRTPTYKGKKFSTDLATNLAESSVTVVSGLARGIDSCSHKGALKGGGKTVAVMGSGLDVIYPPENRRLYDEILERGCILSQFPPGTPPYRYNFPLRNRVMAALSSFICVVEATRKSGSLITARFGLEMGKEIFAVPGNPLTPQSEGTNEMIKNGAAPLTSFSDIMDTFGFKEKRAKGNRGGMKGVAECSEVERRVIECLREEMTVEEISLLTEIDIKIVCSSLSKLEIEGLVERAGDGYFMRKL